MRKTKNPVWSTARSGTAFSFPSIFDVIKAKKNLYVDVRSIDTDAMEKDPEYFGKALQMCSQLNILRIMQ